MSVFAFKYYIKRKKVIILIDLNYFGVILCFKKKGSVLF